MTIAVCPGSYDPVTAGHLDVIERCARFFDEVHVVVAVNAAKTPMFPAHTRVDIIRQALDRNQDNRSRTANELGISRRALLYKLHELNLDDGECALSGIPCE